MKRGGLEFLLSAFCFLLFLIGCTSHGKFDGTPFKDKTPFNYGPPATNSPRSALDLPTRLIPTKTSADATPADKKPHTGVTKYWEPVGPWPQFITYEVEVFTDLNKPATIVTTTNNFYTVTKSNGPMQFIGRVRARDVALPNPSEWR